MERVMIKTMSIRFDHSPMRGAGGWLGAMFSRQTR
jgi:hypothetical protein